MIHWGLGRHAISLPPDNITVVLKVNGYNYKIAQGRTLLTQITTAPCCFRMCLLHRRGAGQALTTSDVYAYLPDEKFPDRRIHIRIRDHCLGDRYQLRQHFPVQPDQKGLVGLRS